MRDKLEKIIIAFEELEKKLSDPPPLRRQALLHISPTANA